MSWDFGGTSGSSAGDAWDTPTTPAPRTTQDQPGRGGDAPGPPQARSDLTPTAAPLHWLGLSLLLALVALVVPLLTHGLWPATLGWLLGGPGAIGVLAVFIQDDTRRRAEPLYAESPLVDWGRRAVVVLSLVAVGLNAWWIADFVARGGFR